MEQVFFKALVVELFVKPGSHPYFAPLIPKIYESFMEVMIVLENVEGTRSWWEGIVGTKKQIVIPTFWIIVSPLKHPYIVATCVVILGKTMEQTPNRGLHTPSMSTHGWKPTSLLGYP